MRQIRPRTRTAHYTRSAVSHDIAPDVVVDLRPDDRENDEEQQLRHELDEACRAVNAAVLRLSTLIDQRETLKARIDGLRTPTVQLTADDPSIVAWGFCEDDDL